MTAEKAFFDTNILLYLMSEDDHKANRAEAIIGKGGCVSVQVLNEVTNVARRKLRMSWSDISDFIQAITHLLNVEDLTMASHEQGRRIAERYQLSVYDAMILSSALLAGCQTVYSEDLQDGMVIDASLTIVNPFRQNTSQSHR
ncbi:MAG: PIN domain-containing protein [Hahellaceae bacterium]|nr:PIN domain-containing protein [Hahellaceae bacterium]